MNVMAKYTVNLFPSCNFNDYTERDAIKEFILVSNNIQ